MRRIFFLAFFIFVFQNAQAEEQKLSQAYEQELIERVKSVFSSQVAIEAPERPICATPIFLEVRANWNKLSARTKAILQSQIKRPTYDSTETYDTPQGHFKIHYTREGDDAVYNPDADYNVNGHPDWVDTVAMVLEHVWETEINVLGYSQPPSDGSYPDTMDNGGDGRYDVYLLNLTNYLGATQGEVFVSPVSATSFIEMDNDYIRVGHTQLEWLQVTFAHEFFHAIQMGYDGAEYEEEPFRPYWMEMSAVWMEEMVYDHVNDYLGYLPSFFNHPDWSLKTFSDDLTSDKAYHPYGSCVWPMYLSERPYPSLPEGFDTTIIKNIWEECAKVAGDNAIDYPGGESATDKALKARGATFEEAFREFTVWNYFTAGRARPELFYSEGELFPEVKADTHKVYPISVSSLQHPPENLGSNYVVFVPDPNLTEGGIRIDFDGHGYDYGVSAVGYNSVYLEPLVTTFLLNPVTMSGRAEIYNWNTYTDIVMIPAVTAISPDFPRIYEYQADYDSSLHGESPLPPEDKILQNYPNPFVIKTESDQTFFPFILSWPSRVRIDIFTLSGERVKTILPKRDVKLAIGEYLDQNLAMPWDGKNEDGEYVSSGIYLYQFRTDRATVVKKIAVIR